MKMEILKSDGSCIANPKSEISNRTRPRSTAQSNSKFRISDLQCRIRPISKFLFLTACILGMGLVVYSQETQRSVWDGVYNDAQAQRGLAVYIDQCSNCHARNLEGADMTPP